MISLLAQQSSYDEPTQYRNGTPWFDLNTNVLKIRVGSEWASYADVIPLGDIDATSGSYLTLSDWFDTTNAAISSLAQEATFSGLSTADSVTDITIPASLRTFLFVDTRCFFYINGLLVDPRDCIIINLTTIRLSNISLDTDDEFTVILRRVPSNSFYAPTVSVP